LTAPLSSVPPQLYSHGSAVLGSFQQVASAAGAIVAVACAFLVRKPDAPAAPVAH
jgi:DHA2 family lincomycin resistance protein-like MFS transporter